MIETTPLLPAAVSLPAGVAQGLSSFRPAPRRHHLARVREDCERLPLADLIDRLRAALDVGNRPMLFLLVRYGNQRAAAEAERGRSVRSHADLLALHDALREVGARFTDADAR